MAAVIQVNELRKSYGSIEALKGVSLDVHPGEVFGLLGQTVRAKARSSKSCSAS